MNILLINVDNDLSLPNNTSKIYNELSKNNNVIIKSKQELIVDKDDLNYDRIICFERTPIKIIDEKLNVLTNVFNKPKYIEISYDKYNTYLYLKHIVKQPKTYNDWKNDLSYPFVIKKRIGSLGNAVCVVNNDDEFHKQRNIWIKEELFLKNFNIDIDETLIYQECISSSWGKDLRVVLIGGKYVACELRKNDSGAIQSNLAQGGNAYKYSITEDQIKLCEKIAQELKLDYVGIDMLFGENDELIFCEANSNAFYEGITNTTGIDVCKEYVKYIEKEK